MPSSGPVLDLRRRSVNARCLEELNLSALPRRVFDGRNWEAAVLAEKRERSQGAP